MLRAPIAWREHDDGGRDGDVEDRARAMRQIVVRGGHSLGLAGARRLAEATAKRLSQEHGGTFQWEGDTLRFPRPGASGRVAVTNDDAEVRVDLGLFLPLLRACIAREIHGFLDDDLGDAGTTE